MSQLQPYNKDNQPLAMAGLFSWLKKAVSTVLYVASNVMSGNIVALAQDFTDGDGQIGGYTWGNIGAGDGSFWGNFWSRSSIDTSLEQIPDYPLTAEEELQLDLWVEKFFIPLFKNRLEIINGWRLSKPSNSDFTKGFNKIQEMIAVFNWYADYIKVYGEPSRQLSDNAVITKAAFLKIQADILNKELEDYLTNTYTIYDSEIVTHEVSKVTYAKIISDAPETFTISQPMIVVASDNTVSIPIDYPQDMVTTGNQQAAGSTKSKFWLGLVAGIVAYKLLNKKKN